MFRHKGKTRTTGHDLAIASLLSCVAGTVNVVGFLEVKQLTTNVTGHFAFMAEQAFQLNFWNGITYFFYIFSFFLGSFISSFIVEISYRRATNILYLIPVIIESCILFFVAIFGTMLIDKNPNYIAFLLLFAMGVQNSLVTRISKSVVRTTHLTGLFTDLGIELSQGVFYNHEDERKKLWSSIKLRLTIIASFFFGGIFGGVFYTIIGIYTLIITSTILLLGIFFDEMRLRISLMRRSRNLRQNRL